MKTYFGTWDYKRDCNIIRVTGGKVPMLDIKESQKIHNKSPFFMWGQIGDSAAQTALAILQDCVNAAEAERWHVDYASEVVSTWDGQRFSTTSDDIMKWLSGKRQEAITPPKSGTKAPIKTGISGCPTGHPGPAGSPGPIQG